MLITSGSERVNCVVSYPYNDNTGDIMILVMSFPRTMVNLFHFDYLLLNTIFIKKSCEGSSHLI